MKKRKLSTRNKIEMLIGRLVILIIESLIGCGLILGFFALIGAWETFCETHIWAFVLTIVIGIISMFKMVGESA